MANATATVTAVPGYIGGAWGFRREIRAEGKLSLCMMLLFSAAGGLVGAFLLTVTSDDVFAGVGPWLLLAATLLFAFAPRLLPRFAAGGLRPAASMTVIVAASIYGGYFNGGLGVLLLAAFSLSGFTDLHAMNGLKNAISALLSMVSALTLTLAGLIAWDNALILAVASMIGGFVGAHGARRIDNTSWLRVGIVFIGLALTVAFVLN